MSFDARGFLSPDVDSWASQLKSQYESVFHIADSAVEMCQGRLYEIKPLDTNVREVLIAALYGRSLSNFQAVMLCLARGMEPEAAILSRSLLETVFYMRAISLKPDLAERYAQEDALVRKEYLQRFLKLNKGALPAGISPDEVTSIGKQIEQETSRLNYSGRMKTADWANAALMEGEYLTAYAVLSADAHVYSRNLVEQQFVTNPDDQIVALRWGPSSNNFPRLAIRAVNWMLLAYECSSQVFKLETEYREKMLPELNRLAKQYDLLGI